MADRSSRLLESLDQLELRCAGRGARGDGAVGEDLGTRAERRGSIGPAEGSAALCRRGGPPPSGGPERRDRETPRRGGWGDVTRDDGCAAAGLPEPSAWGQMFPAHSPPRAVLGPGPVSGSRAGRPSSSQNRKIRLASGTRAADRCPPHQPRSASPGAVPPSRAGWRPEPEPLRSLAGGVSMWSPCPRRSARRGRSWWRGSGRGQRGCDFGAGPGVRHAEVGRSSVSLKAFSAFLNLGSCRNLSSLDFPEN